MIIHYNIVLCHRDIYFTWVSLTNIMIILQILGEKSVVSMMSTTCGMDMDNYPSKFCNDYYCIYCEKTLSRNVKHIDDQNNSKSHIRFSKLQENTQALKRIEERERERKERVRWLH